MSTPDDQDAVRFATDEQLATRIRAVETALRHLQVEIPRLARELDAIARILEPATQDT